MKVSEGFRVRFKPSEADLVSAYEYGYQFGCIVQNKEPVKPKKKGARTLVKCLVCGEIFDSSLEICPVCGVGKENFIEVEAEESAVLNNTEEYYVILGNGTAGFNAAKAIRERDKTGAVTIISDEEYPAYNRPMLTKSIVAGLSADQIAIVDPSWYEENKVFQMLGKKVASVDVNEKEVILESGEKVHFTRLIYALGSECFIPPIEGSSLPEVVAIRRLADVEKLEKMMEHAAKAVVIGGGVLGLEAAWELKKAGIDVQVLEAAPILMGRQLDENASDILRMFAEKSGVKISTGVSVEAVEGDGHVSGVRLSDGQVIPAEVVVVSAGVRANTALAKEIGLDADRAVKVNGRIAGANAAGDQIEYAATAPTLTFHGMNTALFAAGDNGKNPNLLYKTAEFKDMGKGRYSKYYFLNNRLAGVIMIGDLSDMVKITEALEKHALYKERIT